MVDVFMADVRSVIFFFFLFYVLFISNLITQKNMLFLCCFENKWYICNKN